MGAGVLERGLNDSVSILGNRGTVTRRCPCGCVYTTPAAPMTRCPRCGQVNQPPREETTDQSDLQIGVAKVKPEIHYFNAQQPRPKRTFRDCEQEWEPFFRKRRAERRIASR